MMSRRLVDCFRNSQTDHDFIPSQPRKPLVPQSLRWQLFNCAFLRPSMQYADKQWRQRTCRPCPQDTLHGLQILQLSQATESAVKGKKKTDFTLSSLHIRFHVNAAKNNKIRKICYANFAELWNVQTYKTGNLFYNAYIYNFLFFTYFYYVNFVCNI